MKKKRTEEEYNKELEAAKVEFNYIKKIKDPYELATFFVNLFGIDTTRNLIVDALKDQKGININSDWKDRYFSMFDFNERKIADLRRARERTQSKVFEKMMLDE